MTDRSTKLKKRIFLNLDGTGQAQYTAKSTIIEGKASPPPVSNVARISRATLLEDEENGYEQVVYYQTGIGAGAEESLTQKVLEGGLGKGLISNIREAYAFLCNNYDYGDEIYITGFSRGAYTARSVAGMIGKCGILTKPGLEKFYEAFEYYQFTNKYKDQQKPRPVSEQEGTTRIYYPDTNPPQPIKIRAVGVWDTVGGLRDDEYDWHDTALGTHIEHGYHLLSLDERRGYFGPTLWECPNIPRPLENFEQCWMAGDHSNVGGSWEDQQLADIALAWMMSRFDALGAKFNENYLYKQYINFNEYVEKNYASSMRPRQWGEGQSREVWAYKNWRWGGYKQRTPGEYPGLRNTNETMHPVVRYRNFCTNQGKLGADDKDAYSPPSLKGWTWPSAQKDGKIGAGKQPTTTIGPLKYTKKNLQIPESPMGKFEKQLLALYDQDPTLRKRDGSVWQKVLGGTSGPNPHIQDAVSKMSINPSNPYTTHQAQPAEKLYIGTRALVPWDEPYIKDYAHLGNQFRVGTWNGSSTAQPGGPAPFSSLATITRSSRITSIRTYFDPSVQALAGLSVHHDDGIGEWYSWGQEGYEESTFTLEDGERISKMATKAFQPEGRGGLLIFGIRLETDKGRVWTSSRGYEAFQAGKEGLVRQEAPGREWFLKGFYGALGDFLERVGPVWGKEREG